MSNKRRFQRISPRTDIIFPFGKAIDVSANGMFIATHDQLKIGDRLIINKGLALTIRWCGHKNGVPGVGTQYSFAR